MMTIRGVIHLHSSYSYDGQLSLTSIANTYKKRGCQFIIPTEHAENLGEEQLASFTSDCESLSENDFLVLPGLEFSCKGNLEILGLNIAEKFNTSDPKRLIENIQGKGGLAVLSHPHKHGTVPETYLTTLEYLNGVEVWNRVYDGKHAPRLSSLALLKLLRKENGNIFAYAGIDLHREVEHVDLFHSVTVDKINAEEIISSLGKGMFHIGHGLIKVNSDGNIKAHEHLCFKSLNLLQDTASSCTFIASKAMKLLGIKPTNFLSKVKARFL